MTAQPNPQVNTLKNDKAQNAAAAVKQIQMLSNRLDSGDDFANAGDELLGGHGDCRQRGRPGLQPRVSLQRTDPVDGETVLKLKRGSTAHHPIADPASKRPAALGSWKTLSKEPAENSGNSVIRG